MRHDFDPKDETLIIVGLALLRALLPLSGYSPELRKALDLQAEKLTERIQSRYSQPHDPYDPYDPY